VVLFAEYFNVGLAKEEWELPMYRYANLEVTLAVPPNVDWKRYCRTISKGAQFGNSSSMG